MEKFLREWRQDALNKHQHDTAIFVGDKVLALTEDPNDAFWLAQVHFTTGNYTRALGFLNQHKLIADQPACKYLAGNCLIKQGKYDEALNILGLKDPDNLQIAPGNARRKHLHIQKNLRNGTSRGGSASHNRIDRSEERDGVETSTIRYEAGMCYLRGLCHAKMNAFDSAKECYKNAVRIDVQCFEAFDQLMKNSLLSPTEEWEFIESLDFDSISNTSDSATQEAAAFTKLLYTTRLSKYAHPTEFAAATEELSTHYNLSQNADILLSRAELLFTQCRFRESLYLTNKILARDKYNMSTLPLHLANLHELDEKNALFLLSHDLADNAPHEPTAWLAVGIYYLSTSRIADARRFFSKASFMDPHFGPAWIGFAHTFAAEGEHDQAISAYATAARLFQGTHLPQLFLGMQNLMLNNTVLAREYLNTAFNLCKTDPLLLNEMGVCFYHSDDLPNAIKMFRHALHLASYNIEYATARDGTTYVRNPDPESPYGDLMKHNTAFTSTRANLGHALRRAGHFEEALEHFSEVIRLGGRDTGIFAAKGLCYLEMGQTWDAIGALHQALSVNAQDTVATELLNRALELIGEEGLSGGITGAGAESGAGSSFATAQTRELEEEEFDRRIGLRRGAGRKSVRAGRKARALEPLDPRDFDTPERSGMSRGIGDEEMEGEGAMSSPPEASAYDMDLEGDSMAVDSDDE
ncbi:TPR-like protein [Aulographum hederae CBS 113979]|uniref:TPR-like protein n=1 Tax=Aulographum hederae CBS 113979 TaxID=1176131 RepID=A0A6G1HDM9_9PEZI|nr:TPR-like protein [Aulographum hederae CBS 113979]